MSGNLALAGVLLIVGVLILRFLKSRNEPRRSRRWLPLVAFLCGPLIASACFVVDVFFGAPHNYIYFADYLATFSQVLMIGIIGGGIGAVAFWIGDSLPPKDS